MRLSIKVLLFGVLTGCGAVQTTEERWAATGHPVPDLACRAYLDISYNPSVLLYLYFRPPNSGRILMASGSTIDADYSLQGTAHVWYWGTDQRTGRYAYAISVSPNGHGYYYDWTTAPVDQAVIEKYEDYMCDAVR